MNARRASAAGPAPRHPIALGAWITCAETGERFRTAVVGSSYNYAWSRTGELLSDAGVDIRERRAMLEGNGPFGCYLSEDGRHVAGWKGNALGFVTRETTSHTGWHGSTLVHVRVTDCHGNEWHGKGAGRGMLIRLHRSKGAK